jgi:hypothetical protein
MKPKSPEKYTMICMRGRLRAAHAYIFGDALVKMTENPYKFGNGLAILDKRCYRKLDNLWEVTVYANRNQDF